MLTSNRRPGTFDPTGILQPGPNGTTANRGGSVQAEITIDPDQPAITVQKLAIRENGADVGLGVQVVPRAADERVGMLAERRVQLVFHIPGCAVVRRQHTDRKATHLARQLRAIVRIDHRASVDQRHRPNEVENLRPLYKKGPELGVAYGKTLVHLDPGAVRLDL